MTVGEGKDYLNISSALSNATNNSIILVSDGIYHESIIVDKEVIIRSENGSANTTIHPDTIARTINITAHNVTIDGFNISNNVLNPSPGIFISSASNCTLVNNDISGFGFGIGVVNASRPTLINNSLSSNYIDILLENSISGFMENNDMASTGINFGVYGDSLEEYIHDINSSNKVHEQPLYYLVNQVDYEVPTDAGQVYAVNSQNITIRDLVVGNGLDGVALINTSNSTIENVTVSGCYEGILLFNSEYNLVRNVTAVDNYAGIHNHNSSNTMLLDNIVNDNFDGGIFLCGSDYIALLGNGVSGNGDNGVSVWRSNYVMLLDNTIHFNVDDGIDIEESNNVLLDSNAVNYNSEDGIDIEGSYDILLGGNVVNYNSGIGITIYNTNDSTLTNNTANENAFVGIYLHEASNITLMDNTVDSTGAYGVAAIQRQDTEPQNMDLLSNYGVKRHSKNTINGILSDDSMPVIAIDSISYGLKIENSDNITLSNTHATGNDCQLQAYISENLTVDNIIVTDESAGISFAGTFYDIRLSERSSAPASPSGKTNVNGYVDIAYLNYGITSMPMYVPMGMDIKFSYDDPGMNTAGESSVALYNLSDNEWIKVAGSTLNTQHNYVSASISAPEITIGGGTVLTPAPHTVTLALFKDSERTGSSGSSVIARERSQGTITDLPRGNDGGLAKDTVVKSSDSTTTLTLFTGTKALDPLGNPVNSIIVTTPSSLPSDTPREVIESGLYFRFGPSGTTFSQQVMVTMDFDPADFEGRAPVIYTYTSEDGWIALETTVDWENGRATAMISHFSLYALFGTEAEETTVIIAETQGTDINAPDVQEEETLAENESGSSYLYWVIGLIIVLIIAVAVVRPKKKDGEL
ncbi:right-handed parallel beta-helix repeat-containing protein [Methanolobus sp.]|uniref:right-handed parallel beta-helix repeat-containing protein n=1 Tax=Methanolobus sp. TaxID=1874737 RepID=UPI0025F8FBE4|nr:right-handed parallel beta-helix repeat-containing protein [Methanolobus sp.]